MPRFKRHAGEKIGQWTLRKGLGSGGNGEVWEACKPDGAIVALKIVHYQDAQNARYKRFQAEVGILKRLEAFPGILPYLDAFLPDEPSVRNPAWLAMPVATSIENALGDSAPLETTVEAVASIAHTLASLLSTEGISHRDIKPGNLYCFQDGWAVGDFGLADYPDKEALTRSGEKLGPANFLAPEMLDAKYADGAPADVYSLGKTLWVLASGQKFPPPGEIRLDRPEMLLGGNYVGHDRVLFLDRLIERATFHNPQGRVTMTDFANELDAWLRPPTKYPLASNNLADIAERVEVLIEPARVQSEREERLKVQFVESQQRLIELLGEIEAQVRQAFPHQAGVGRPLRFLSAFPCPDELRPPGKSIAQNSHSITVSMPSHTSSFFAVGAEFELFDNGKLYIVAANVVGRLISSSAIEIFGRSPKGFHADVSWMKNGVVPMGSVQQEKLVETLMKYLNEHLREAMESFLAKVQEGD